MLKAKSTSKILWIFAIFILGLSVFLFSQWLEERNREEIARNEAIQVEKEKRAKQAVQILLTEMKEENKKYDDYASNYEEKRKERDLAGALTEASKAYKQAEKLEKYYFTSKVPAEVPEHVLSLFEGLESELSVAFGLRAEAFELVLRYLDKQNPADLASAEEKLAEANDYFLSGSENIDLIQKQMGITME
jgi:Na+-transporting methylmalonyl-CoA/oxaloacetate decarboxylase gamma subunit